MHISLTLLVLKSAQPEQVQRFYQSLGFQFKPERHGNGPLHYSTTFQGMVLEIYPLAKDQQPDSTTRLGFSLASPDQVLETIEESGGVVVKAGHESQWGYLAIIKDPDGRTIELYKADHTK